MKNILIVALFFLSACTIKEINYGTTNELKELTIVDLNTQLINKEYLEHYYNGMNLAIKEINKSGGIRGISLKLVKKNDFSSYTEGYLQAKEAIIKNNAVVLTGTTSLSVATAVARVANETNTPFLSTGVLSDSLFNDNNTWAFRMRDGYDTQVKALVSSLVAKNNLKSFVIVRNNTDELITVSHKIKNDVLNVKSNTMFYEDIVVSNTNIKDEELLILDTIKVDAIIVIIENYTIERTVLMMQKYELTKNRAVFFMQAGEPEWLESLNSLSPNYWSVTGFPWYSINTKDNLNFVKKYNSNYKVNPRYSSYIGYITVYYIAEAYKNIDLDNKKITKNNQAIKDTKITLKNKVVKKNAILQELNFRRINTPLGEFYIDNNKSNLGTYIGSLRPYNITTTKDTTKTIKLDIRMFESKYFN